MGTKEHRKFAELCQRVIAQSADLTVDDLCEKSTKRKHVEPRHLAMYLVKEMTGLTLEDIGLLFGGRDHSTVIHACKCIQNRMDVEPFFRAQVADWLYALEDPQERIRTEYLEEIFV